MKDDPTKKVISTIKDTINNHDLICEHGHVVIGLSGGPDSMCLFHTLCEIKDELRITISAVHLNHKFRPGAAEEDQDFVEKLCQSKGVYCHSKTVDVNKAAVERGETPEEAGRTERYIAFDEEADRVAETGIPKDLISIAVAQNKNDQVETVLMRIMRGTGADGLAGIPYKRNSESDYSIIRPLLDVDRESIENYCEINGLNPRIDHTNSQPDYGRNKIRLNLIPQLKSDYNFNIEDALIRLSSSASMDKEYFAKVVDAIIDNHCAYDYDEQNTIVRATIEVESLRQAHTAIARRIIVRILKDVGLTQGIEASHIEAAENLAIQNKTGSVIEFPEGYRMRILYDVAEFYNEHTGYTSNTKENKPVSINLKTILKGQTINLPEGLLTISPIEFGANTENRNAILLDYNEFMSNNDELIIRYRHPGDRIRVKGMTGTKKVQDLFVDEKIVQQKRDSIPMLVSGDEIIWIMGVRRSGRYVASEGTKDCLLLEWEPNN